jgi:tRNA-modifying protein YgfZ
LAAPFTTVDLSARGRLAVSGPDAPAFLQNQLTCDVGSITAGRAGPGALCTNKGRVVAAFTLFLHDGAYVLAMPASIAAPVREYFTRMIFRSKVTAGDLSATVGATGVHGAGAEDWLRETGLAVPESPWAVAAARGVTTVRYPGAAPRFELYGSPRDLDPLAPAGSAAGEDRLAPWTVMEIESGLPWIEDATAGQFLPQFLDMDRRGGLSFTKGCFPGQEVVARTQHLGEVKRRMFLARCAAKDAPLPGTPLRAIHDDGDRDGGTVVRAARAPAGDIRMLAVVPVAEREAGREIHLASAAGPLLTLEDLP